MWLHVRLLKTLKCVRLLSLVRWRAIYFMAQPTSLVPAASGFARAQTRHMSRPPPRSLCGRTTPVRWRASFHMFLQLCTACSSVSQTHTTHLQTSFCLSLSVGHITTIGRRPGPQRMVPQRKVVHHALGAVSTPLARAAFGVTGPLPAHLSLIPSNLVGAARLRKRGMSRSLWMPKPALTSVCLCGLNSTNIT